MSNEKKMEHGCVTKLNSELHTKYDVQNIPYQNLSKSHPLRMAWTKDNPDGDWNNVGKNEVAMRQSDKLNGREYALSYGKLVRQTAIRCHGMDLDKLINDESNATKDITDTNGAIAAVIITDKKRLFQNLIWTVGLDNITFGDAMTQVSEIVNMFINDVCSEYPHAKAAGKSKSKAEVLAEKDEQDMYEARAYVKRLATLNTNEERIKIKYPEGVGFDKIGKAWVEIRDKYVNSDHEDKDRLVKNLDDYAVPFKSMWGITE